MIKDCDNKIIRQAIRLGSLYGVNNISTKEISHKCKLNEGTIFVHFKSKENLLYQCYKTIDRSLSRAISLNKLNFNYKADVIYNVYNNLMDYLIKNKFKTKYYLSYIQSDYYIADSTDLFINKTNKIISKLNIESDIDLSVWYKDAFISILKYSVIIADKKMKNTKENKDSIFGLLFDYFTNNILK